MSRLWNIPRSPTTAYSLCHAYDFELGGNVHRGHVRGQVHMNENRCETFNLGLIRRLNVVVVVPLGQSLRQLLI